LVVFPFTHVFCASSSLNRLEAFFVWASAYTYWSPLTNFSASPCHLPPLDRYIVHDPRPSLPTRNLYSFYGASLLSPPYNISHVDLRTVPPLFPPLFVLALGYVFFGPTTPVFLASRSFFRCTKDLSAANASDLGYFDGPLPLVRPTWFSDGVLVLSSQCAHGPRLFFSVPP